MPVPVRDTLRMAYRSLVAYRSRALLNALAIAIGAGATMALLSVGHCAQVAICDAVASLGTNLIVVVAGRLDITQESGMAPSESPLTLADADALGRSELSEHIQAIAPSIRRLVVASHGSRTVTVALVASTPEYEHVKRVDIAQGAFFEDRHLRHSARVAVLGHDTAVSLFGAASEAMGQSLRVNQARFVVVGVIAPKGGISTFGVGSQDELIIAPLTTATRFLFPSDTSRGREVIDYVNLSALDATSAPSLGEAIVMLLTQRPGLAETDLSITSQQELLRVSDRVGIILTLLLGTVASVSVIAGGVGIMNIMLVSVSERRREIGLRRAVGATPSEIQWQFLTEAMLLCTMGGLAGIGLGLAICGAINLTGLLPTRLSGSAVSASLAFSLAIGIVAGYYPAQRAARQDPITALRDE